MLKLMSYTILVGLFGSLPLQAGSRHNHLAMNTSKIGNDHQFTSKEHAVIKVSVIKQENIHEKTLVQIKLTRIKDDQPIALNDLKEAHTQKVHLLIIDDSLTDYHHIHPETTNKVGVYQFEWTPKINGNYRLWADLLPVETNQQQYVAVDLIKDKKVAEIDKASFMQSTVEGYTFKLSFENENLIAGNPVMGKIIVTNEKGEPVKTLEPVMAAYAHIVGFSENQQSVVHLHPMGTEPTKKADRGGPELEFHLQPMSPGFIKLFAQVKINGKELFVPFGINIKAKA